MPGDAVLRDCHAVVDARLRSSTRRRRLSRPGRGPSTTVVGRLLADCSASQSVDLVVAVGVLMASTSSVVVTLFSN